MSAPGDARAGGKGTWRAARAALATRHGVAVCLALVAFTAADGVAAARPLSAQAPSAGSAPGERAIPHWFRWGPSRPDLVRFNRVEGASLGARGAVLPLAAGRPLSVVATGRLGIADLHPNARVDVERSTVGLRWTWSGYHELAPTEEDARHLGLVNSLAALLAGRDDGDYFRRSGMAFRIAPPHRRHAAWEVGLSSEYHRPADVETRFAMARLWEDSTWTFRPNFVARQGWEHAVSARWAPSWGTDPSRPRVDLFVAATGALGDLEHALARTGGAVVLPLSADWRIRGALAVGAATRDVPPQRAFALGGPMTVRGYAPRTLAGACEGWARLEVQRIFAPVEVGVFTDQGWAGPCRTWSDATPLRSVGAGLALVDGVIRADLARALNGDRKLRLHVYLDGRP